MALKLNKVSSCVLPKVTVTYRDKLEPVVKARYLEKLKLIEGKDPYELKRLSTEVNKILLKKHVLQYVSYKNTNK